MAAIIDLEKASYKQTVLNPTFVVLVQHQLGYRPAAVAPFQDMGGGVFDETSCLVNHINDFSLVASFEGDPFDGIIYVS